MERSTKQNVTVTLRLELDILGQVDEQRLVSRRTRSGEVNSLLERALKAAPLESKILCR